MLAANWYELEIKPGVDCNKPGIYQWWIDGAGIYIGKYTNPSRPFREYTRNVNKILAGKPYRKSKPAEFRHIHLELWRAVQEKRRIRLTILENAEAGMLNQREQQLILETSANLNGPRRTHTVFSLLPLKLA